MFMIISSLKLFKAAKTINVKNNLLWNLTTISFKTYLILPSYGLIAIIKIDKLSSKQNSVECQISVLPLNDNVIKIT